MKYIILLIIILSCTNIKETAVPFDIKHIIIYKTNSNYRNKVPVILSDDKKRIISYPQKNDLVIDGTFRYPIELKNGYLLDVKGISLNSVFLDITYEEYYQLEQIDLKILTKMITDYEPFESIYDCGDVRDYYDIVNELNAHIKEGIFDQFKRLK